MNPDQTATFGANTMNPDQTAPEQSDLGPLCLQLCYLGTINL